MRTMIASILALGLLASEARSEWVHFEGGPTQGRSVDGASESGMTGRLIAECPLLPEFEKRGLTFTLEIGIGEELKGLLGDGYASIASVGGFPTEYYKPVNYTLLVADDRHRELYVGDFGVIDEPFPGVTPEEWWR